MPCCCYFASFQCLLWQSKPPRTRVWLHETGTEQIIDNKWDLLPSHLNLLLITGRRQGWNADEPALSAVWILRVSNTSSGKVFQGAYIMDIFKKSASMNLLRGIKLLQFNALVCAFSQGCSLCPVPTPTALLPFISFLPLILSAQALRTSEGINCLFI